MIGFRRTAGKKPGRANWCVRWGSVLVAAAALALYVQGLSYAFRGIRVGPFEIDFIRGMTELTLYWDPAVWREQWVRVSHGHAGPAHDSFPYYLWFHLGIHERYAIAVVPLWVYLLADVCIAGLAWRRWLRWRPPGACPKCGYDLRGLAAGSPCPECGRAPAAA